MAFRARFLAPVFLLLALTVGSAISQPAQPPAESAALKDARQKVRDLGYEINRTEGEQKRLSPPMRTHNTDGSITFNADRQRTYERELERLDRRIRDLRNERTDWELRVNRLVQSEAALPPPPSVAAVPAPAPLPAETAAPPAPRQDSAALQDAKKKVRDIGYEIGRTESELRQLSPPIRIHNTNGTVTFNADKQKTYESNKERLERRLRDLRNEKTEWELRGNRILQQDAMQVPR